MTVETLDERPRAFAPLRSRQYPAPTNDRRVGATSDELRAEREPRLVYTLPLDATGRAAVIDVPVNFTEDEAARIGFIVERLALPVTIPAQEQRP